MNLKLSGLGAEPKKMLFLGIIVLGGGGYAVWSNMSSSDGPSTPPSRPAASAASESTPRVVTRQVSRTARANQAVSVRTAEEFRPSMKRNRDDPPVDPNTADPTLRLDLLAMLQKGEDTQAGRSLFDFGAAAPIAPVKQEPVKIVPKFVAQGPKQPPPPPTPRELQDRQDAAAPAIPLKFYGFVNRFKTSDRRAFFMDGEDIIVASEGQMVKNRYKILKVGLTSAEVEDTQYHNHKQTLQIVEEAKEQG